MTGLPEKPGVHYTPTALVLPNDLTFEEWDRTGETLFRMSKAMMWWIADWVNYGERRYGEMYAQTIDVTKLEYKTIANARWVGEQIESSRRRENLSFSHHAEVAALPPGLQDEWLDRAVADSLTRAQLRGAVRQQRLLDDRAANPLPDGKYNLILADPPWEYEQAASNGNSPEKHYPTMPLDNICEMPVGELAADDCILFLWAPNPKIMEAGQVIESWGFTYRTAMTWVKDKIGTGFYVRQRQEQLLIAAKGSPGIPDIENRPDGVIEAPRGEHSAKPPIVYEILESMYPDATRIELFARTRRDGWDAWGNQAPAEGNHA